MEELPCTQHSLQFSHHVDEYFSTGYGRDGQVRFLTSHHKPFDLNPYPIEQKATSDIYLSRLLA
jgi:hypothetical protein